MTAATALTAALGGCGGTDSEAESSRLSKAEFIEQANALCERERANLERDIAEFRRRRGDSLSPRELNADIAHFILFPTIESELEAIRTLREPLEEERAIIELLYAEELAMIGFARAQKMGPREALARKFTESGEMLRAYGLDACANDVQSL